MNPASALPHVPEVSEAPPSLYALLKEDIDSVMSRDPAARSRWEVLTTYPGVHAILAYRFGHNPCRRVFVAGVARAR